MIPLEKFDYIVVGSGLAGLSFALSIADHGKVCVTTKAEITDSNTQWAQGGIAAAMDGLELSHKFLLSEYSLYSDFMKHRFLDRLELAAKKQ